MVARYVVLLAGLSISASSAAAAPQNLSAFLTDLEAQIGSTLAAYYPDAQIQRNERKFIARYDTQQFTVHGRNKMGRLSRQTSAVEGPNNTGFLLRLTVKPGAYQGAAVVPQTIHRPYWEAWIHAIEDEARDSHLSVSFAYGQNVDSEFVAQVIALLSTNQSPGPPTD